ncbi:hypothetical protein EVAR_12644_1 [Eumeta japonica]|uniref:Uncharacterized protein n=1 Tax=Eumeta variegata TaxID=151549 RepID=A0A4C1ZD21_EUMVA|nr:hypothetical protein EVAR_12644_1 [Eumeta japonica]
MERRIRRKKRMPDLKKSKTDRSSPARDMDVDTPWVEAATANTTNNNNTNKDKTQTKEPLASSSKAAADRAVTNAGSKPNVPQKERPPSICSKELISSRFPQTVHVCELTSLKPSESPTTA